MLCNQWCQLTCNLFTVYGVDVSTAIGSLVENIENKESLLMENYTIVACTTEVMHCNFVCF